MNGDPKIFLHWTYSKFRLSAWLSDLWPILKIILSDLTLKKGPRVRLVRRERKTPGRVEPAFLLSKFVWTDAGGSQQAAESKEEFKRTAFAIFR
jgi:hypothetical protein